MKPISEKRLPSQIAYEAFASVIGAPEPWDRVERSPVAAKAWIAAATAIELDVRTRIAADMRRLIENNPDRPVKCKCGARHMWGETHACVPR